MPARKLTRPVDPVEALRQAVRGMSPAALERFAATLDAPDLTLLESIVEQELGNTWRHTPDAFMEHLSRGARRRWAYIKLLGQKFADAVEGRSIRQIWNLPARYGKSTIASQWGPAWALDRDPSQMFILTSYGDELALENAYAVREILRVHRSSLRCELSRDRQRLDRFATPQGGGLLAAGIDSTMTGFGANGIVIDDPFKNWQDAHSEARRKHVVNQYRSVVRLRLNEDHDWIILVMTRWHEFDLTGWLVSEMEAGTGEQFEVVRLPAVAELPNMASTSFVVRLPDPLHRAPGEILEPARFSAEAVAARHLALGSYLTAGMEQQRPAPEEGDEIKRAWWRVTDALPPAFDETLSSWDTKLKDKEAGDYVVGQLWGRTGADYWLIDQLRGQWSQAITHVALALLVVRYPYCDSHVIEAAGFGPELRDDASKAWPDYVLDPEVAGQLGVTDDEYELVQAQIRQGIPGVVTSRPEGDKRMRMRAVAGVIEARNCHLNPTGSWLPAFLDEVSAFPNGGYDDQVDACSQALKRLRRGSASVGVPGQSPGSSATVTSLARAGRRLPPGFPGPRRH